MESQPQKLQQRTKETSDLAGEVHHSQKQEGMLFEEVEDLLRYDSDRTQLPGGLADRLQKSIDAEKPVSGAWWRRFLGF